MTFSNPIIGASNARENRNATDRDTTRYPMNRNDCTQKTKTNMIIRARLKEEEDTFIRKINMSKINVVLIRVSVYHFCAH